MTSSQKPKVALALALILLCLSGTAAGFVIFRLNRTQAMVRHTYDVEVAVGDLESSLTQVGRTRVAYVNTGSPESLALFEDAVNGVKPALARIRQLINDNPSQMDLADQLETNAGQRVAAAQRLVELKEQHQSDPQKQLQFNLDVAKTAFDTAQITQQMKQNEDELLQQRNRLSNVLFASILSILAVSFVLAAIMFWVHYRLLSRELYERGVAESQLRQLSLELMRVQDEEHRRFARELHDGLGQSLSAAKMMAFALPVGNAGEPQIAELAAVLDDALKQTRTISHLFHPPLLDEIGFASAARWLIDGYAKRTGVAVLADIPEDRFPKSLELTLYRVLQEALNNIHRHSQSAKAEVSVETDRETVTLRVKDYGEGIPDDKLAALQTDGAQAGVGLLSMKERVREQHGKFEIRSHETGTEIVAKIPLSVHTGPIGAVPPASLPHRPPLNLHDVAS